MNVERELRSVLRRVEAPRSLASGVMAAIQKEERSRGRLVFSRIAASVVLMSLLGFAGVRYAADRSEKIQGEAARDQVLLAMKITAQKTTLAKRAMQHAGVE